MTVEYHPAVQQEVQRIRDYYNERVPGLGGDFVDEFERQVLRIAAAPKHWMVIKHDVRRSLMKRFPYIIYFREIGLDRVRITVVKHERRHPARGLQRK